MVKADAYGHGAIPVSRAAVDAGVSTLGVALVEEGVALRDAGIDASILVLSEPVPDAAETVVQRAADSGRVHRQRDRRTRQGGGGNRRARSPLDVHLKIDTGMHRVGCRPADALDLARHVVSHRELRLAGTLTHFAVADEPANPYTAEQLARFDDVLDEMRANGIDPGTVHACNTAGTLAVPAARRDLVRVGIGLYGIAPAAALEGAVRAPARARGEGACLLRQGRRRADLALVRPALHDRSCDAHRNRSRRLRRRRSPRARAPRRAGARARPPLRRSPGRSRWTS